MNLALLAYEMKAAGIKSLAIELSTEAESQQPYGADRPTLAPGAIEPTTDPSPEPEKKSPDQCAAPGCGEKNGGIFGGQARHLCRAHAMQLAGVRA